jgi:hypothetical protein
VPLIGRGGPSVLPQSKRCSLAHPWCRWYHPSAWATLGAAEVARGGLEDARRGLPILIATAVTSWRMMKGRDLRLEDGLAPCAVARMGGNQASLPPRWRLATMISFSLEAAVVVSQGVAR